MAVIGLACTLAAAPLATSTPASAASAPFGITTTPALSPAFSVRTTDYAVSCAGHPTTHVVTTGAGSVVGGKRFPGRADVRARLVPGQSLQITGAGHSYFVRCLPADFPKYSATVNGTPQTNGLLVTPAASLSAPSGHYVVAFDAQGVPVWWYRDPNTPTDAKFFGSSIIGWASGNEVATAGTFSLRGLNGSVKHTVGTTKMTLDEHDLQLLPGGNYLAILDVSRPGVDLSTWGLSSQSTITDNEIVELNAANKVVWSWSVAAHIDVATANLNWRNQFPDVIHMNSIQLLGNHELVFSSRHFDAVYAIDMRSGAIIWKLGGTLTAQSLTVTGDQYRGEQPGRVVLRTARRADPPRRDAHRARQRHAAVATGASAAIRDRSRHTNRDRDRTGDRQPRRAGALLRRRRPPLDRRLARLVGHSRVRDRVDPERQPGSDGVVRPVFLVPRGAGGAGDLRVTRRDGRDGGPTETVTPKLGSALLVPLGGRRPGRLVQLYPFVERVGDSPTTGTGLASDRQLGRNALGIAFAAVHCAADMADVAIRVAVGEGPHLPHTRPAVPGRRHTMRFSRC